MGILLDELDVVEVLEDEPEVCSSSRRGWGEVDLDPVDCICQWLDVSTNRCN